MPSEKITALYSQHTRSLQRLGASYGNDVIPYLNAIDIAVQAVFRKYSGRGVTQNNREAIIKQINLVAKEQLQLYVNALKKDHKSVGASESVFAVDTMKSTVEADIDLKTPSSAQVNALAISTPVQLGEKAFTSYNSMMSNYWQKWTAEIDGIVMSGFTTGQTIDEIADNIYPQLRLTASDTSDNVLNRAKRSARQLAITGTNHYANQATIAFVSENDDQIKGYRFLAVLDSRTSSFCRPLDQKVFAKDDPRLSRVTPPRHPNCRSRLVYEVDDRYKLDTKDSKRASNFDVDGKADPKQVSSDGIYYQKMKQLSASDQDAILGPTLGKAFRKLDNPEQFARLTVDSLSYPLTISEMKKRDNALSRILNNM